VLHAGAGVRSLSSSVAVSWRSYTCSRRDDPASRAEASARRARRAKEHHEEATSAIGRKPQRAPPVELAAVLACRTPHSLDGSSRPLRAALAGRRHQRTLLRCSPASARSGVPPSSRAPWSLFPQDAARFSSFSAEERGLAQYERAAVLRRRGPRSGRARLMPRQRQHLVALSKILTISRRFKGGRRRRRGSPSPNQVVRASRRTSREALERRHVDRLGEMVVEPPRERTSLRLHPAGQRHEDEAARDGSSGDAARPRAAEAGSRCREGDVGRRRRRLDRRWPSCATCARVRQVRSSEDPGGVDVSSTTGPPRHDGAAGGGRLRRPRPGRAEAKSKRLPFPAVACAVREPP